MADAVELRIDARNQRKSVRRLLALIRHSLGLVVASAGRPFGALLGVQLVAAAAVALTVLAVKLILDAVLSLGSGHGGALTVAGPLGVLALLTAVSTITGPLQTNLQRVVGDDVLRTMWQQVFEVSTSVSLRHFETPAFHDRLRRVQTSALSRPYQLTQGLTAALGAVAASIGLAIALVALHPLLLPLLVLGGVPMLITGRKESQLEFDFAVRQTASQRIRGYLTMVLTGSEAAKEIRSYGLAGNLRRRFEDAYAGYSADLRSHVARRTRWSVAGGLGSAVMMAATLGALVWLIADHRVSVAAAGAALVAIRSLAAQLPVISRGIQQVFESGLFLDDLDQFIAVGREDAETDGTQSPAREFSEITVTGAGFSYPTAGQAAVQSVDLHLRRGEVVALVGENGSGKSTLAKLIAGLYTPDHGSVRWDGIDSRQLRRSEIYARTAVVFQDFARLALSAEENIAMIGAADSIDQRRVRAAARATGADTVIDGLPFGYETPLSTLFSGGQDLSGGQWQRIALARAYYRDAPLVILDEPTAALDPRAEHELFASLRQLLAGRTALFISHRFSTVRTADRIYVMDGGRIIESGNHDDLMAADGHYAELFRLQASAYLAEGVTD